MDKNNLSLDDRLKIYSHYCATQLGLKYSFHIVDKAPLNPNRHDNREIPWDHGRGKPDKEFGNIALYFLWKDLKMLSFDDFQKERIYDWLWRFEEEFQSE